MEINFHLGYLAWEMHVGSNGTFWLKILSNWKGPASHVTWYQPILSSNFQMTRTVVVWVSLNHRKSIIGLWATHNIIHTLQHKYCSPTAYPWSHHLWVCCLVKTQNMTFGLFETFVSWNVQECCALWLTIWNCRTSPLGQGLIHGPCQRNKKESDQQPISANATAVFSLCHTPQDGLIPYILHNYIEIRRGHLIEASMYCASITTKWHY